MPKRGKRTGPPPVKVGDTILVDGNPRVVTRLVGSRIYWKHRGGWDCYVYARSFGNRWRLPIKAANED
jgi:hypothetical protein